MNACMRVCISMLCFMLASTVHNLDCYFTSIYLWLCILFLLIVNLLLILRFILIMCVYFQLSSFCLFYFVCRSFLLIYSIRLCLSLQLPFLNFFSLVTCFLVMNALFNCLVLCLLHLLCPLQPCFVFCLFAFSRRHLMLFSPLYTTIIAIVKIVFIIVVFWPSSYYF